MSDTTTLMLAFEQLNDRYTELLVAYKKATTVDEAMIERAADELAEMFGDWLGNPLADFTPEAERVLRAALEVSDVE